MSHDIEWAKRKDFLIGWMDHFLSEVYEKIEEGTWPQSHLDEIHSNADMKDVFRLACVGDLGAVESAFNSKTTETGWLTASRKVQYLAELQNAIANL